MESGDRKLESVASGASPRMSKDAVSSPKSRTSRGKKRKVLDTGDVAVEHNKPRTDGDGFVPVQASAAKKNYRLFPRHILMASLPSHFPEAPTDMSDVWSSSFIPLKKILQSVCEEDVALIQQIRRWKAAWLITRADAHIPVVICGSEGVTRDTGWTEKDLLGTNVGEKFDFRSLDREKGHYLKRMIRTHTEHHCLIRGRSKSGDKMTISLCVVMLRDKNGNIKFHLIILKGVASPKASESGATESKARKIFDDMMRKEAEVASSVTSKSSRSSRSSRSSSSDPWTSIMDMSSTSEPDFDSIPPEPDSGNVSSDSSNDNSNLNTLLRRAIVDMAEEIRLTSVFATNPTSKLARDELGPVVFASSTFVGYTGLKANEVYGAHPCDLFDMTGGGKEAIRKCCQFIKTGVERYMATDLLLLSKNGPSVPCHVELRSIRDVSGRVIRTVFLVMRKHAPRDEKGASASA